MSSPPAPLRFAPPSSPQRLAPLLVMLALALAPAASNAATCDGLVVVPPVIHSDDVGLLVTESSAVDLGDEWEQTHCFVLDNTGGTSRTIEADFYLDEVDQQGAPGPWEIRDVDERSYGSGASVTCSLPQPDEARMVPDASLGPAEHTNECCFTWYLPTQAICLELPAPGDGLVATLDVDAVIETVRVPLEPVLGGSSCGLLGIEALLAVAVARRMRGRR